MPDRPCLICRQPLEPTQAQTCPPCLARTRSAIMEIVELFALLPAELEGRAGARKPFNPTGVHSTDDPLPGGDVLVMLAHGSTMWRDSEDLDSVAGRLDRYANDWREHLGMTIKYRMQDLATSSAFLLRALDPMAQQHPTFAEFAQDMYKLRDQLRWTTQTSEPTEWGVECPYCGHRLTRRYTDPDPCTHPGPHRDWGCDQGGRRDDWLCSGRDCGRTYDPRSYNLAVWHHWNILYPNLTG